MRYKRGSFAEGSSRDLFLKHFGKQITEYKAFQDATDSLGAKTVDNYLKSLPFFFLYLDEDPDQVIAQRKLDITNVDDTERYEKKTILYAKSLTDKGMSGFGVAAYVGRIQGFFANNGKRLALDLHRLKFSKARKRAKYSPSNEDLRLIYRKADYAMHRLVITIMYQNGAAPVDVSLLKCGDYPREPWVYRERTRSKTGEVWRFVSTPDACEALNAYLTVRGKFKSSDPLFVGREGPMNSLGLSQVIRELLQKTGLDSIDGFKPTSLRDAFEDALVDAEIYPKLKEALMAHNSGIEGEYGGQKKLEERLIQAMKKVYPLICLNDNLRQSSALPSGFSEEDIEGMKMLIANKDAFMEIARLIKEKKLYTIDDPALIKRLKEEGKI